MNKKYLSVILFGALMLGTAGTFTSCKDYDDDIANLQEQIDANKAAIDEINTLIQSGGVITNVESTSEGVVVTLSNGKTFELKNGTNGTPGSVVTMGDDGYWYIDGEKTDNPWRGEGGTDAPVIYYVPGTTGAENGYWVKVTEKDGQTTREVTSDKWLPEGTLTAVIDGDNLTLGNIKIDGVLGTKVISLGGLLRSMVFIPELYYVDPGTRYAYAPGEYIEPKLAATTGTDDELTSFTIAATTKWQWNNYATPVNYVIAPIDSVYYHLNPINTNIQNVDWSFLYKETEVITRGTTQANPVYINNVQKDGKAAIAYKIENPDKLSTAKELLSIMALNAKLSNDSVVTSDYATIVPAVRTLNAIAYTAASSYTTNETCVSELYHTGKLAAENLPTLTIAYNDAKGIDLKEILSVHYLQKDFVAPASGTHSEMSYKETTENYGLEFRFETMPYITGNHTTSESQYGVVENGVFYPCYVDNQGNSIKCGTGTTGISAVGRRPIVLVTLVDPANDEVLLAGYVKIDIVAEIGFKDYNVKDFGTLPYLCGGFDQSMTWAEMSKDVYEQVGMTKEQFNNTYDVVPNETYEKVSATEMKRVVVGGVNDVYGMLTFVTDDTPGSTNDKITWKADFTQMDNIYKLTNHTKTIYLKFVDKTNPNSLLYLGLTVTIADKPEVTMGEKIDRYWYPSTVALAQRDTVRMNVPRPTSAGITSSDVLNYNKDMDDNFVGNKVEYTLTSANQNQYYTIAGNMNPVRYEYYFAPETEQPEIVAPDGTKYQLTVNSAKTKLLHGSDVIATIDPATGVVEYQDNAKAKLLLNLFGHAEAKPNQLFGKVDIIATYGTCELALHEESFNLRFLRPVDVLDNNQGEFIDAQANGSTVKLGDLFGLQDWRDVALLTYNSTTDTYAAAVENGVNLYDYYKFTQVFVNLDEAECDLTGTRKKLADVTTELELDVIDGGNAVVATGIVPITNVSALNTYKVRYMNNGGNVQDFNLWIPIEISYSWGTVKAWAHCTVDGTMAN